MTISPGEEFRIKATPSQALLRKLAHLATQGTDSVLTGGLKSTQDVGASDQKTGRDNTFMNLIQLLSMEEQARQQQIQLMNERLDRLERLSEMQLQDARERLERIRQNANRTRDGRLAFADTDGTIYDEHGTEVSRDEIDQATWDSDRSSWREYKDALSKDDAAQAFHEKVSELGDRLKSDDLSDDDLKDLDKSISVLEREHDVPDAKNSVTGSAKRSTSAAKEFEIGPVPTDVPKLQKHFDGPASGNAAPVAIQPTVQPHEPLAAPKSS